MKKSSAVLLRAVVVIFGLSALIFMLWEPHVEGRNVDATLFEIYFKDPFLACAYLASLLFFTALYQVFKVLGYTQQNKIFSEASVKALRTIKYCMIILAALIAIAEIYLFVVVRGKDDIAGGVAMGLCMLTFFVVSAAIAARFEHVFQSAVNTKIESDLIA